MFVTWLPNGKGAGGHCLRRNQTLILALGTDVQKQIAGQMAKQMSQKYHHEYNPEMIKTPRIITM